MHIVKLCATRLCADTHTHAPTPNDLVHLAMWTIGQQRGRTAMCLVNNSTKNKPNINGSVWNKNTHNINNNIRRTAIKQKTVGRGLQTEKNSNVVDNLIKYMLQSVLCSFKEHLIENAPLWQTTTGN